MEPCKCGAYDCPSCGVAQGTLCPRCLEMYDEDGKCACDYDDEDIDFYVGPDGVERALVWRRGRRVEVKL